LKKNILLLAKNY